MTDIAPYRHALTDLWRTNLGVQNGERVLIVTDTEALRSSGHPFGSRHTVAELARECALSLGAQATVVAYTAAGAHGTEPPLMLWQASFGPGLERVDPAALAAVIAKQADAATQQRLQAQIAECTRPQYDVLLALSKYSISHTRFRNWLSALHGTRAATMPGFEPGLLTGVMRANWHSIDQRSSAVARLLTQASSARLISHYKGETLTLHLDLHGREGHADGGLITARSDFGNLPGGEAFTAPVEGKAEGSFAAYAADGRNLMRLDVRAGLFAGTDSPGDSYIAPLVEGAARDARIANLAELGVGTNDAATDTTSVLEGEKILGTCHIAFGDNHGFGGTVTAPFHRDFIVPAPELWLTIAGREQLIVSSGQHLLP